jgi:hypothetical protein
MGTIAVQTTSSPASTPDDAMLVEIVERAMHSSASEWLFFRELRVGTGRLPRLTRLTGKDQILSPHPLRPESGAPTAMTSEEPAAKHQA